MLPNEGTVEQTAKMQAAVTAPEVYGFAESSHISALSYLDTGP